MILIGVVVVVVVVLVFGSSADFVHDLFGCCCVVLCDGENDLRDKKKEEEEEGDVGEVGEEEELGERGVALRKYFFIVLDKKESFCADDDVDDDGDRRRVSVGVVGRGDCFLGRGEGALFFGEVDRSLLCCCGSGESFLRGGEGLPTFTLFLTLVL